MDGEAGRVGQPRGQAAWAAARPTAAQTQVTHAPTVGPTTQTGSSWWTPRTQLDQKGEEGEQELRGKVLGLHAWEVGPIVLQ